MQKAIVSVIGKDKKGIIATVSALLFQRGVNIEDISQTVLGDYFAMIMLVDVAESSLTLSDLAGELSQKGKEVGVNIQIQHEDLFNAMHKI